MQKLRSIKKTLFGNHNGIINAKKNMRNFKNLILLIVALVGISVSTLASSPPAQKPEIAVINVVQNVPSLSDDENVNVYRNYLIIRQSQTVLRLNTKNKIKPPPTIKYFGQPPEVIRLE